MEFFANTFGPLDAFDGEGQLISPMTYTWQFQQNQCNLGCLPVNGAGPNTRAPIASNGVYDYTFPTSGTYSVILTATDDKRGASGRYLQRRGRRCATHGWRSTRTARPPVRARTVPVGTTTTLPARSPTPAPRTSTTCTWTGATAPAWTAGYAVSPPYLEAASATRAGLPSQVRSTCQAPRPSR